MSSQGQGDGGVYVSTQGPASYGLGTRNYELNIIKDCFGVERIEEYEGKGKLDVIIIYACEGAVLQQAPGGRDHAKMVSKSTFRDFSLQHADGNYFLRPDRILGAFHVDSNKPVHVDTIEAANELIIEKNREHQVYEKLDLAESRHKANITRIETTLDSIWTSLDQVNLRNENDEQSGVEDGITSTRNPHLNFSSMKDDLQASSFGDIEMNTVSDQFNDDKGSENISPLMEFSNEDVVSEHTFL